MPAPTFSNLTASQTATDGTSCTTASISPTGSRLVLATIHAKRAASAQPPQPTLSGGGMTTWDLVEDCIVDVAGSDRANQWVFRSMQSSPGSGALTFDFGAVTCSDFAWSIDQSDANVDTSGTNGSGAIGNTNFFDDDGAGTSVSASLTVNSGNSAFASGGCQGNPPSWTNRASFTTLGDSGQASCRSRTSYLAATDTAVSYTHASSRSGIVGVEVKAAASSSPLPTVTETDTAQALTGVKDAAAATVTETDTAQAVTGAKTATAITAAESDTAQPVTGAKVGTMPASAESDTAQPVTGQKSAVLGTATETDTAQPLIQAGAGGTLPTVTETDTAQPVTAAKAGALEPAAETDTGQALTAAKTGGFATTAETDAARPITGAMAGTLGPTVETDTAQALTAAKTGILPITIETDTAQPFSIPLALSLIVKVKANRYSARPAANTSLSAAAHARYTAKG